MKIANSLQSFLSILFSSLLVLSCGGGGGGGDDDDSTLIVPTTGVSIISANAEEIASLVLYSDSMLDGASAGMDIVTGVSISVEESDFSFSDLILQLLQEKSSLFDQSSTSTLTGVVIEVTIDCPDGGDYTATADVLDPNVDTVGDSYTFVFNDCVSLGVVIDGTMAFTLTELSGNPDLTPPYVMGVDADMTSFTVSYEGLTITSNGDMNMRMSEDLDGNEDMEMWGNSFESSAESSTVSEIQLLTNYLYKISENNLTGDFVASFEGTIASTEIGGSVSYVTLTNFTGNDFVDNGEPSAGVLHITTSKDNSQALVTAQPGGIDVQIEVDADGDGLYETIIMTTWTELESA